MRYLPLDIPPGVRRSGTEYQSRWRWYDTNLVRWYDGAVGPILGWVAKTSTPMSGKGRAIIAWRENDGGRRVAVGTHSNLYVVNEANARFDITPASFTAGRADAVANLGYGGYVYGSGAYGTPRPDLGAALEATVWDLDLFGQYLIGCSPDDGKIYEWQNNTGTPAAALSNAPTGCSGVLVTPERAIMALGAGGNKRKYQWSDLEADNSWTPGATNQAGDGEVPKGKIVLGRVVGYATLLLTDVDAHVVEYVGLPFVYSRRKVGDACGGISRGCIAVAGGMAAWWSPSGFWVYDGAARPLPCDVWDDLQLGFNASQRSKISAFHSGRNSEIWWLYPSGTEVDSYVYWNYKENYWGVGALSRLCGIDAGIFSFPLLMGDDGYIYEHETGFTYDGDSPFARSGPIELGSGDRVMHVLGIVPDEKSAGEVSVSFRTRFYPNAAETVLSETTLGSAGRADLRFAARQVELVVSGESSTTWRWGSARLEIQPGSKR